MYNKLIVILFSFILINLSGCAILARPYENVSGVNTAQFTVSNPFYSGMFVHTFAEAEQCKSRYLIGFLRPENNSRTISISTEKVFVYRQTVVLGTRVCKLTIAFTPAKDKKYYASMAYHREKDLCESILYEELEDKSRIKVEDAYLKSSFGGTRIDENSTWCSKDELDQYIQ